MAFTMISLKTLTSLYSTSLVPANPSCHSWRISKFHYHPSSQAVNCRCKYDFSDSDERKFVLHDALELSGMDTTHVRAGRDGFCSQIKKLSDIERETSISVNKGVDLGRVTLHIAAEDDSLVSHSSVPLPVDDFIERLDSLSMGFCSHYSSSFRSQPDNVLERLERYLYVDKGFRRANAITQVDQRALYLNSVLIHRSGSVSMLSLIYSEILKMLRMWGILEFDVEIFCPHDSDSCPRGYRKQKSTETDQLHILTTQSVLVEVLRDLKNAFWPFQLDHTRSPFLRAAQAAQFIVGPNNTKESASDLASAKAAHHRMQKGVWTNSRFGDMRRALAACERLILLKTDPTELRDYAVLLYHCGFSEESLHYLQLYQNNKLQSVSTIDLEEDVVEKLIIRLNLIMMEDGGSRSLDNKSMLFNNSQPW